MVSIGEGSDGVSLSSPGAGEQRQASNSNLNSKQKGVRFPDYILCGQINLHRSPECAAALAKYIDKQWDYLRINHNGIISSKQLEINRDPDQYGGLRNGKPLTVTEWNALQKEKLIAKRKQLAEAERGSAIPDPNGEGLGGEEVTGAGRGSRGHRGRGGTHSRSRGRGRGRASRGRSSSGDRRQQKPPSRTRARGRSGSRGRARGRGAVRGGRTPISEGGNATTSTNKATPKLSASDKSLLRSETITVKPPRLARSNLRDKGQLPRKRGPDKRAKEPLEEPLASPLMETQSSARALDVEDEFAPDVIHPELTQAFSIPQYDGNISDSDLFLSDSNRQVIPASRSNGVLPDASMEDSIATLVDDGVGELEEDNFQPGITSTQIHPDSLDISSFLTDIRQQAGREEAVERVITDDSLEPLQLLGASWVGSPIQSPNARIEGGEVGNVTPSGGDELQANQNGVLSPNNSVDPVLSIDEKEEELFGVSPSAFLYAIQEPCVFLQKVVNISGATVVMDPKADRPRAAIVCSTHLNMWPDPEYCSRDMVTCLLRTKKHGDVYVVSLYCDADEKPVPDRLMALQNKARKEKRQTLILGDLNSHSSAGWNSKSTDSRGIAWEKFIFDKGLRVLNKGDRFTFMASTGQSIVDVNMATPQLADLVKLWATVDHIYSSDHVLNEFMLLSDDCWTHRPRGYALCPKVCNWPKVTEYLEQQPCQVEGNMWSLDDLNRECSALIGSTHVAMQRNTSYTNTVQTIYKIEWWNKNIQKLNTKMKVIRQYLRKWSYKRLNRDLPDYDSNRMKHTWEELVSVRRSFKKACRKAKRKWWKKTVEAVEGAADTAQFSKRLNRENNAEIGLFTKPSGERCNIEETMDMLMDTHFPGNVKKAPKPMAPLKPKVDITDPKAAFITPERLQICIRSFKPRKGAGPDGLKPAVYQHYGPKALQRLANLYKASYLLGIQPDHFKLVRVIYIPKPGRPDYSVAKAHRPISLMNFIMKIMEKFLLWHHEDTILLREPLENEQHGFMKAKSCDSAITTVVSHAEHAMIRNEFCVLALLDVEGAFDNATYESMLNPLKAKGTPENFVSWILDFLYSRKSQISVKGVEREIYHTRGTPQGGCSSPYLWACVINELIKMIKPMDRLHIVCYADDIALISKGPDLEDCIERLQRGIDAVENWAAAQSLRLSHSKSEILLVTQKRKYFSLVESAPRLCVGGDPVDYAVGSVRYLGVWLDRKLSWSDHVKIKCTKVKKLLMKALSATGRRWGLQPYQGLYFWQALGRSVLSYGCLAWQHSSRKKFIRNNLRSCQRLGFQLIAQFRKGTPNSGLELIFNCSPVDVYLAKMATKAYFRTLQHAPFTRDELHTTIVSKISHRCWIRNLIEEHGLAYLECPLDVVPLHRRWDRKFEVDWHSMSPHNPSRGTPDIRGFNIYTDGSKDGRASGAGVAILDGGQVYYDYNGTRQVHSYHLGERTTVFQSELFAQKMAATLIINSTAGPSSWAVNRPITINVDNQASIMALDNVWIKSRLVQETVDLLDRAAECCEGLKIRWVRAHSDHKGNEIADEAAREGRDDNADPDWETPLLAKAVMHSEIDKMATKMWEQQWDEVIGCRQTRHWFPKGPRPKFSKGIIQLTKPMVSNLVMLITGHTHLKRHQAIIDESERQRIIEANGFDNADDDGNAIIDAPDPSCSRCKKGDETPLHLLSECDSLATLRKDIFGREDLVPKGEIPDFSDLPLYKIVSFFLEAGFPELSMRPYRQEHLPTDLPGLADNQELKDSKAEATKEGNKYLAKYLYHIPIDSAKRTPTDSQTEDQPSSAGSSSSSSSQQPASLGPHSEDEA